MDYKTGAYPYSFIPCGWISIGGAVKPYPHGDKAVDASHARPKRDAKRLQSHSTWIFPVFRAKNVGRNMALSALDDRKKQAGKMSNLFTNGGLHIERSKKRRDKKNN